MLKLLTFNSLIYAINTSIWDLPRSTVLYCKIFYLTKDFWQVDPTSKYHGGDLVAQVLKSHGIEYIFTLVGGHISPILVGSEKLGIKVIDTRQEVGLQEIFVFM